MSKSRQGQIAAHTRAIHRAMTMGALEAEASREYESNRYDPEKGGPALARLNRFRKNKSLVYRPKEKS